MDIRLRFDSIHYISVVFAGLREADRLIRKRFEDEKDELFDVDSALEHLEDVYGTARVLAQTYINRTWAEIEKAFPGVKKDNEKFEFDRNRINGCGIGQVELLYHLANYWKHHDEWPRDWNPANMRPGTTKPLNAAGITHETDFVCVRGLEKIDRNPLDKIETILPDWRQATVSHYVAKTKRQSQ